MLIRFGYDIRFDVFSPTPFVVLLQVSPLRIGDLLEPDRVRLEPAIPTSEYIDVFGNRCSRFLALPGNLRLWSSMLIRDSGLPDPVQWDARQVPVEELPVETLQYLFSSRYCEVDRLSNIAAELFGSVPMGWPRVQAVCDWVHQNVTFGYQFARSTKTAVEVYAERTGVCRDLQHLAITFCRCLNIPARYAAGYLGDIGIAPLPDPMDFSSWFEVYLNDRWWAFDARHNIPRIGRVLLAVGRDAADAAITTSFGQTRLTGFEVLVQEESATRT
jgi:transglutaminase-like putative cysteine protease